MIHHRVFVIWSNPLFLESLRLLMRNAGIQCIGAALASERKDEELRRLKPDTILVELDDNGAIPCYVVDLMETSPNTVRIFHLSLADNNLQIYHREKRTVMQPGDLLSLIRE